MLQTYKQCIHPSYGSLRKEQQPYKLMIRFSQLCHSNECSVTMWFDLITVHTCTVP